MSRTEQEVKTDSFIKFKRSKIISNLALKYKNPQEAFVYSVNYRVLEKNPDKLGYGLTTISAVREMTFSEIQSMIQDDFGRNKKVEVIAMVEIDLLG